jgi:hypothetical protein
MKVILLLAAIGVIGAGASQALARPAAAHSAKTVMVVMHDPGCHWFQVGTAFKTSLSVKGPIGLMNMDEATLRIAGPAGTKLDRVGKTLPLAAGTYRITMVGQAPDDNHLKLVVK